MSHRLPLLGTLLIAWFAVQTATAATVRFRPAAAVDAAIVTLGDVADVLDADAARVERLKSIQLVPAPPPGQTLRLEFGIVRSRLQAHGVNLAELEFSGRSVVEVRRSDAPSPGDAARSRNGPSDGKRQRAERIVAEAIREHCRRQAPELGVVQVAVELRPEDIDRVVAAGGAGGGTSLTIAQAAVPVEHPQPLVVRIADRGGRAEEIRVTVRVTPWPWVLAVKSGVPQGHRLQLGDLAWVQVEAADGLFAEVEQLVGQEAARPIRGGEPVRAGDVRSVPLVRSGDIVTVASRRAGIVVRRPMKARGDGALGEEITVVTLDGRDRLSARVTGLHEAEVGFRAASVGRIDNPSYAAPAGEGLRIISDTTDFHAHEVNR